MSTGGSPQREDALRLAGSVGVNKVMAAELLRLVKRSPFRLRVPEPKKQGSTALRYPFSPELAWVAACYHRSSSRVSWEMASSATTRLEPLHDELVTLLAKDERLDAIAPGGFSVEIKEVEDFEAGPLQVRGVVKNALIEAARRRGRELWLETEEPDWTFQLRMTGRKDERRCLLCLDLGGGPRHRRGQRVAQVSAPLRETLAAQLILLSRWDPRTQVLVDPMAGGATIAIEGAQLARGIAVRQPVRLGLERLPGFEDMPADANPLYPDTRPYILASDEDEETIKTMIGNLRATGLTGVAFKDRVVVQHHDARELRPENVAAAFGGTMPLESGLFAFNPPYGKRMDPGQRDLVELYRNTSSALHQFQGWRAAIIVAHPGFMDAWGGRPVMRKPTTNAGLTANFLVYDL
jgi:23S rRNA G2445 N2-methylase RlmL